MELNPTPTPKQATEIRFISSLAEVTADEWNKVVGSDYPFLRHEFLYALEKSGCVGRDTSWQPQHLVLYQGKQLSALMPMYLKYDSYGEYVFDWSWADAYHRHKLEYYPKLLSAIPFTPATGPRFCTLEGVSLVDAFKQAVDFINNYVEQNNLSSWHLLFPDQSMLPILREEGLGIRSGCQYHWFNRDYRNFNHFLETFSSRKRKNIKRERRRVREQNIELQRFSDDEITSDHISQFFKFYAATYIKRGRNPYLNEFDAQTLYGRYWGSFEDFDCLHFEACFYQGIEFCIERDIARFDPGAQGEHKILRGFEPVETGSAHWIQNPAFREAIEKFLTEEQKGIDNYIQDAATLLPFKKG